MKHLPAHSRNPWHHDTYGDYITGHHRWPAVFSIWVRERVCTECGKCNVSATRLCAGQSPGTFPPNTCRAQHSGYLTRASRTGWLACALGDVHSPLRRGSPVLCYEEGVGASVRLRPGSVFVRGCPCSPKKQRVRPGAAKVRTHLVLFFKREVGFQITAAESFDKVYVLVPIDHFV